MIIKEYYGINKQGLNLYRTFSDAGFKIRQIETGAIYDEAVDIETHNFTYEETTEKIPVISDEFLEIE